MAFLRRDISRGRSRQVATCRARKFLDLCEVSRDKLRRDEILFAERRFLSQAVEMAVGAVTLDRPRRARMARVLVADGGVLDGEGVLVGAGRGLSRLVVGHCLMIPRLVAPLAGYPQTRAWRG